MPAWAAFTAVAAGIAVLLLLLSQATRAMLTAAPGDDAAGPRPEVDRGSRRGEGHRHRGPGEPRDRPAGIPDRRTGSGKTVAAERRRPEGTPDVREGSVDDRGTDRGGDGRSPREASPEPSGARQRREPGGVSTGALLANVTLSQGVFLVGLLAAAWAFGIPASAFDSAGVSVATVATGVGAGGVLYACNELGATLGRRYGFAGGEELRALLAPDTAGGWTLLLGAVLPTIAVFEELLFRGALIGVPAAGFDVSPWALAVVSSAAFGLGHGAQGRTGIAVTGLLGFALAAVYVASGSLLLVITAHYLVNALEFVVHEGLGREPFGGPP